MFQTLFKPGEIYNFNQWFPEMSYQLRECVMVDSLFYIYGTFPPLIYFARYIMTFYSQRLVIVAQYKDLREKLAELCLNATYSEYQALAAQ